MTEVEKLTLLRAMVGTPNTDENWSDDVLISYLTIAGRKIINRAYPYNDEVTDVPRRYGYLQCVHDFTIIFLPLLRRIGEL